MPSIMNPNIKNLNFSLSSLNDGSSLSPSDSFKFNFQINSTIRTLKKDSSLNHLQRKLRVNSPFSNLQSPNRLSPSISHSNLYKLKPGLLKIAKEKDLKVKSSIKFLGLCHSNPDLLNSKLDKQNTAQRFFKPEELIICNSQLIFNSKKQNKERLQDILNSKNQAKNIGNKKQSIINKNQMKRINSVIKLDSPPPQTNFTNTKVKLTQVSKCSNDVKREMLCTPSPSNCFYIFNTRFCLHRFIKT